MKNALINRLVAIVASINVSILAMLTAVLGCLIVLVGVAVEASFQADLAKTSLAALEAYQAQVSSHQLSIAEFLVESLTGGCYAHGAFLQGLGVWIVFALTPLVIAVSLFARSLARKADTQETAVLVA